MGKVPPGLLADLRSIFTVGKSTGASIMCAATLGRFHALAVGYVTIDVVAACVTSSVASPATFASLPYDNVLTGDYHQLNTAQGHAYAASGPLVHIRAVPEGGPAGAVVPTSLPYTFYDRYAPDAATRKADRRQPLPAVFALRYIAGGTNGFNTKFKIWREGFTAGACSGPQGVSSNSNIPIGDVVRFDEHENATVLVPSEGVQGAPPLGLPAASAISADTPTYFPAMSGSGDVAG